MKIKGRKVYFVHGGTKVQIREQIRGIVEKENDAIIVASYGTFSTGININNHKDKTGTVFGGISGDNRCGRGIGICHLDGSAESR